MVGGAVRQAGGLLWSGGVQAWGTDLELARPELAGGERWLQVDPHVTVQVALVAGAVLTYRTNKRLFACVDFEVTVEQRFPHEALATSWPRAGIALGVHIFGMLSHVGLPEKRHATAEVRRVEPLMHGHHVSLQVVPAIGLVATLWVSTLERLVLPPVTIRRSQLLPLLPLCLWWRQELLLQLDVSCTI